MWEVAPMTSLSCTVPKQAGHQRKGYGLNPLGTNSRGIFAAE